MRRAGAGTGVGSAAGAAAALGGRRRPPGRVGVPSAAGSGGVGIEEVSFTGSMGYSWYGGR
jgi:hypothetical protein